VAHAGGLGQGEALGEGVEAAAELDPAQQRAELGRDPPARSSPITLGQGGEVGWKRTGLASTSDMICAMSSKERSSGPSTGTWPTPVHESSGSHLAAVAAMSRVAQVGFLRSPAIAEEETPSFLIAWVWRRMLSMNEGMVSAR
jgi:hypothetical protein